MVWCCAYIMRSDFVRDTTECDFRRYGHLVKHLNKITLMKLTITSTLASIFLLSHISQSGGYLQPDVRLFPASMYPKPVLSPGSLFQLKVQLLFIQLSGGDPVLGTNYFLGIAPFLWQLPQ